MSLQNKQIIAMDSSAGGARVSHATIAGHAGFPAVKSIRQFAGTANDRAANTAVTAVPNADSDDASSVGIYYVSYDPGLNGDGTVTVDLGPALSVPADRYQTLEFTLPVSPAPSGGAIGLRKLRFGDPYYSDLVVRNAHGYSASLDNYPVVTVTQIIQDAGGNGDGAIGGNSTNIFGSVPFSGQFGRYYVGGVMTPSSGGINWNVGDIGVVTWTAYYDSVAPNTGTEISGTLESFIIESDSLPVGVRGVAHSEPTPIVPAGSQQANVNSEPSSCVVPDGSGRLLQTFQSGNTAGDTSGGVHSPAGNIEGWGDLYFRVKSGGAWQASASVLHSPTADHTNGSRFIIAGEACLCPLTLGTNAGKILITWIEYDEPVWGADFNTSINKAVWQALLTVNANNTVTMTGRNLIAWFNNTSSNPGTVTISGTGSFTPKITTIYPYMTGAVGGSLSLSCNTRSLQLPDGSILMPITGCTSSGTDTGTSSCVARSTDGGATWSLYSVIINGGASHLNAEYSETGLCRLPGGSIIAICRAGNNFYTRSVSADGGATWSPQLRCMWGRGWQSAPSFVILRSGIMVWITRWQDSYPATTSTTAIVVSFDEGVSWFLQRILSPQGHNHYGEIILINDSHAYAVWSAAPAINSTDTNLSEIFAIDIYDLPETYEDFTLSQLAKQWPRAIRLTISTSTIILLIQTDTINGYPQWQSGTVTLSWETANNRWDIVDSGSVFTDNTVSLSAGQLPIDLLLGSYAIHAVKVKAVTPEASDAINNVDPSYPVSGLATNFIQRLMQMWAISTKTRRKAIDGSSIQLINDDNSVALTQTITTGGGYITQGKGT